MAEQPPGERPGLEPSVLRDMAQRLTVLDGHVYSTATQAGIARIKRASEQHKRLIERGVTQRAIHASRPAASRGSDNTIFTGQPFGRKYCKIVGATPEMSPHTLTSLYYLLSLEGTLKYNLLGCYLSLYEVAMPDSTGTLTFTAALEAKSYEVVDKKIASHDDLLDFIEEMGGTYEGLRPVLLGPLLWC